MKLGLVICSSDSETVWNAFRFGVFALKRGDTVRAFLLGKGVEAESIGTDDFPVKDQMQAFVDGGGMIQACTTCLKSRQSDGTQLCPLSRMQDLFDLVHESDKVVSF